MLFAMASLSHITSVLLLTLALGISNALLRNGTIEYPPNEEPCEDKASYQHLCIRHIKDCAPNATEPFKSNMRKMCRKTCGFCTPTETDDYVKNHEEKLTNKDILNAIDKSRVFSGKWLTDWDQFMYTDQNTSAMMIYNCSSNSSQVLVSNEVLERIQPFYGSTLSADGLYLLFQHNTNKNFRYSTRADYTIYDLINKIAKPLERPIKDSQFQYVSWGPVGNALVMVQENNIYYKKSVDAELVTLTDTGTKNTIFNGVPDWVYEEEVLETDNAIWWSTKATYLLYATFNDSRVPLFTFPWYGDMDAKHSAYTTPFKIAYPKAGYPNPTFTLNIVHLETKSKVTLSPPEKFKVSGDYLFTSVSWRDDEQVLVTWMNRIQNHAVFTLCNAKDGNCRESIKETSATGWLELNKAPIFTPDGRYYLVILPQSICKKGTYKHIAMVEIGEKKARDSKRFVTYGDWEVSKIEGFDPNTNTVYFTSPMKDPRDMQLYSASVKGKQKVTCQTCNFHKECLYNTVSMSHTTNFYILSCLGPHVPFYSLLNNQGTEVLRLENNTEFAALLAKKAIPKIHYELITLKSGEKLWAQLHLPPHLKQDEILEYPILLNVYGGPGSQSVTHQHKFDSERGWETYLPSVRGIIYAKVDTRGTRGRGDAFAHSIYKHLGTHEVDDPIEAIKQIGNLQYVDEKKMAVWGGSYGGFVSAMILGRKNHQFKCGISVAPLTDWIFYDSIYTERYMDLPIRNPQGYREANVSKYVENFKSSSFMLVHGTGDDNVHFQNSAQFIKALTESNIYFRFEMYPDKDHNLFGGNTQHHLYASMTDFLGECFDGNTPPFRKSLYNKK